MPSSLSAALNFTFIVSMLFVLAVNGLCNKFEVKLSQSGIFNSVCVYAGPSFHLGPSLVILVKLIVVIFWSL